MRRNILVTNVKKEMKELDQTIHKTVCRIQKRTTERKKKM